jgi:probable phosphoglycerate mutase
MVRVVRVDQVCHNLIHRSFSDVLEDKTGTSGRPAYDPPVARTLEPTRITLIRHGESNVTVQRVIGGHRTCSGLSDLGRRQSRRLAERLVDTGELVADVLLSSTYARAVETAEIIRPAVGVDVVEQWADFGEHDPGPQIDGMAFDEYVERFGTPDWSGDPDVVIFPGGETTAVFHARIRRALQRLLDTYAGASVVVACHGGVVDAAFRRALDLPVAGRFALYTLNTSLTEFVVPGIVGDPWRLVRYNDAAHLAGLPDATERA